MKWGWDKKTQQSLGLFGFGLMNPLQPGLNGRRQESQAIPSRVAVGQANRGTRNILING